MATKIYKVIHRQGRTETLLIFQRQEQEILDRELPRMKTEGLIADFIVQTPEANNAAD